MLRPFLLASFVCVFSVSAGAQTTQPPLGDEQRLSLLERLVSKQWTIEWLSNDHARLTGSVELPLSSTTTFFADEIDIYGDTNRLVASGNVVFATVSGRIAAERVEYDLANNTGTFHVATGLMPLGAAADPSQFGTRDADVYFWGDTIEKIDEQKYRITRGGFTTCVQPTPRWELVTDSVVLDLNQYAVARNTVLRVKGVPIMYMPIVYYPIQEDGRATGLLLPSYGTSTFRGQVLSNAFFWAIGRSQDATVFHDWFTRVGQGLGSEYRYVASEQSSGNVRFYRMNQREAEFTQGGRTSTLPESRSFELTGGLSHALTDRIRARVRLDYFSDVVSQQLYHQDIYQASRNTRVIETGLTAGLGPTSTSVVYRRSELLESDRSYVYGSTPRVSTNVAPLRLFGSPVYASMNAEYAYLPDRSISGGEITRDGSHSRTDLAPVVRVPLSRLTFLSVNTSASYRTTYYSRSVDTRGVTLDEPYLRQYMTLRSDVVGPVLTRIWDRPDSVFAERLKHVIEPALTVDMTSRITSYSSTPVVSDYTDFVVSGATRFTYGVTNRFFARAQSVGQTRGQIREFLTVGLQQTYYSNDESARYDSAYQTTYGYRRLVDLSPIALTARVSPTSLLDANMRLEYDVSGGGLQMFSTGGSVNTASTSASFNYSRRRIVNERPDDYLSATTTLRWLNGRANGTYSLSWDIGRSYVVSQSVVGSYLAQCCGLQIEFQTFNYPEVIGFPIPSDTRFNVGVILAGLGTFSNFFGAFGGTR
jgi:LPS-assembly protein